MLTRRVGFGFVHRLSWIASAATADVIYQYTGIHSSQPDAVSGFVSGTIQLSFVLPPNLRTQTIDVKAFMTVNALLVTGLNEPTYIAVSGWNLFVTNADLILSGRSVEQEYAYEKGPRRSWE